MAKNNDRAAALNRTVIVSDPKVLLDKKYTIINFVDKTFPSWYFKFVSKHTYMYVSKITSADKIMSNAVCTEY